MTDFRVFCRPSSRDPSELLLSPDESHHLVNVNRARSGDAVVAFDGRGTEWLGTLTRADKRSAVIRVNSRRTAPPLPHRLTLGQALPKGTAMDSIVRKATELGTARIVPLESARTQVHLEGDRQDRKVEKWQTAALEAAKQCGNPWLPDISPMERVIPFMESSHGYDLKLIASLQPGARSLKAVLAAYRERHTKPPHTVLWLIGPEGDFSPEEMQASTGAGFEPVTLGPLVLRCETAAVYALSILSHELQG
jgi:16S rRNA (uracil1498-N3)-methyltransferase